MKNIPQPFLTKIIMIPIIGFTCLVVGLAVTIYAHDFLPLLLSSFIAGWSAWKSVALYRTAILKDYEVFNCTCIWVQPRWLRRQNEARFLADDGVERHLWLHKADRVSVGRQYRIYFRKDAHPSTGNRNFDLVLTSALVLGVEPL